MWLFPTLKQSLSWLQVLVQVVVPQMYGEQLDVAGGEQAPAPLQKAAGVNVVPLHDGPAHWTLAGCSWHAPPPLQKPVWPQVPPVPAAQRACGSATLTGTLLQRPARPETLQAWQVGQLEAPQQTPSVQKPLVHSWFAVQATPFTLVKRQVPPGPVQ